MNPNYKKLNKQFNQKKYKMNYKLILCIYMINNFLKEKMK